MRVALHANHAPLKRVVSVIGMQRIDLRVLGAVKIVEIVALDGLIEKRRPQRDHRQQHHQNLPAHLFFPADNRLAGRRYLVHAAGACRVRRIVHQLWRLLNFFGDGNHGIDKQV